jgi:hypothetical protein
VGNTGDEVESDEGEVESEDALVRSLGVVSYAPREDAEGAATPRYAPRSDDE